MLFNENSLGEGSQRQDVNDEHGREGSDKGSQSADMRVPDGERNWRERDQEGKHKAFAAGKLNLTLGLFYTLGQTLV